MAPMDTITELGTLVLEDLDFEIPCGHSSHDSNPAFHAGKAEFVALVLHDCTVRPDLQGEKYPCCAKWADKVTDHQDKWWTCPVCANTMLGSDMVRILGPLNT